MPVTSSGFTPGQRILFTLTADNVFGPGEEVIAPTQTAKLTISDTLYPGVKYGKSCAMSGDGNYLVVGAPLEDFSQGAANIWIYKRSGNTWTFTNALFPNPWAAGDQLGFSVDINQTGDRIVVGAPYREYNAQVDQGGTYIFKRTGESWDQEVFIPDPNTNGNQYDYGGYSVVISSDGSMILVGAPGGDSESSATGTIVAYYAESNSWSTVTFADRVGLATGAGEANAFHGSALAISANMLVCVEGAPGDANQGWYSSAVTGISNAGYVALFSRPSTTTRSWGKKKGFLSPTPIADGYFGTSMALNAAGTVLVVGAPGEMAFGLAKAGAVHIFTGSGTTWNIQAI